MATKRIPESEVLGVKKLVELHLSQGATPPGANSTIDALTAVAEGLHDHDERFRTVSMAQRVAYLQRVVIEANEIGLSPEWSLYRPAQYQHLIGGKNPVPFRDEGRYTRPTGRPVTICVIPDIHIDPRLDNDRCKYMGRWAHERNPDYIVQLGDWLTLDSLSTHHGQDTIVGQNMHGFKADLLACDESLGLFEMGFGQKFENLIFTEGNHEFRAHRFEDKNPQLAGTIASALHERFHQKGWRWVPFGEFVFIEGVGFIHHVLNGMGRPYGGKTAAQRVASDSVFSTVSGHTHQKQAADVPKIGPNRNVRAISAGCALPYGHVEGYASHNTTGWWWGCVTLRVQGGVILDENWESMLTIYEKYGD